MTTVKSPLLSPPKSEEGFSPGGLSSTVATSASSIRIQRVRKASYRFSECDGDEDLPQFQGSRSVQYFAALAANMGALALGTVLSWSAVALPDLRKDPTMSLTITQESWVGSIITLGAVAAGPAAGLAIENLGRRMSMLVLTIPFLAGWLLIYFANGVTMILVGRFITGFCSGVYATAAPIFTAEMADVSIRGTLCAGFDMMISVGILLIYVYGAFVGWRVQALISGVLPIIIFIMMLFVPESPRYLVQKGKTMEATTALLRFRGAFCKEQVDPELRVLKISVRNSQEKSGGWRELFKLPVLRPISIAFLIYVFQVFAGIDPVLFYTVDIFASSGATMDEYYSTIIIGAVQVVAALCGAFLVEYFGRRILLMISEVAMVLSLSVLGYYFFLKQQNGDVPPEGLGWLPLSSIIIYVVAYSVGMGPVGYMIMGEVLPHHVKGVAGCLLTSAKWFMSFAMTKFFLDLINLLGNSGCYWFFGSFCLIGFFYVFFFVPETRGKTLDEIQREFSNSYAARPAARNGGTDPNVSTPLLNPSEESFSSTIGQQGQRGGYQSLREGNYA